MELDIQLDWQEIVDEAHRRRKQRKLPMRRLAAQANVSLPTVLRFEKNQRDIQLSSVLAILNALGMVAKPVEGMLLFEGRPDGPYEVRFAPNEGAGGELDIRSVPDRAALLEMLTALQLVEVDQNKVLSGLRLTRLFTLAGVRLHQRQIRRFWPGQFSRSIAESPHP